MRGARARRRGAWLACAAALLAAGAGLAEPVHPEDLVREAASPAEPLPADLGDAFRRLETDHFTVLSDASPRYRRLSAALLEQFTRQVHPRFFEREMPRVTAVVVNAAGDYKRLLTGRGLAAHARRLAVYDPRTRTLYARRYFGDDRGPGFGTLFHETMHAMLHAEFADGEPAPAWFQEGFASLFEAGAVLRGEWVYGNPNPWRDGPFREAMENGRVASLARFFALGDEEFRSDVSRRPIYYNTGRSLFLYLLRVHGEKSLRAVVQGLRAGRPAGELIQEITGLGELELESAWRSHVRDVNFGGDYLNRAIGPRALDILHVGASKHPDYGNLRLELAIEHLRAGERPEAVAEARAALEDPRCLHPHLAYSVIARALISDDMDESKRALEAALSYQPWLDRILAVEYELLAKIYAFEGDEATMQRLRDELLALKIDDGWQPIADPQQAAAPAGAESAPPGTAADDEEER